MDYIKLELLLAQLKRQADQVAASVDTMKALIESEIKWKKEEEDQYRMRHSD